MKKRIDNRKVLLLLPLFLLPLLALGFKLLGGGAGNTDADQQTVKNGINTSLPDATFNKNQPQDKLAVYDQVAKDSMNVKSNGLESVARNLGFNANEQTQTGEIDAKLEALNREINKPVEAAGYREYPSSRNPHSSPLKSDVDRLEALMKTMQENKTEEDPEMKQLNGLMQNILDIQHPERVQQKYKEQQSVNPDSIFQAIPAIIADNKKAIQGATIKLILRDSIRINGVAIPKGHALFGSCKIVNQRLLLDIKQIRLGTSIIPVNLSVYSLDGMMGIDAPEAMLTDALNSGTDQAVRDIGLPGFDQSLATQVAGAGIDAAKDLVSKKLRRVKVKLEAGQVVLLRNNQQKIR